MSDAAEPTLTQAEISNINSCAQIIANANRIVVFSGAGMSAESGIETFRGSSGLWTGIIGTVVLGYFGTPFGWSLTPGIAWSQYVQRFYSPIAKANPNKGHYALAQLEQLYPNKNRCISKGHIYDFNSNNDNNNSQQQQQQQHDTSKAIELPTTSPVCRVKGCGSTLRPDCVLFTESLPSEDWSGSVNAINALKPGDVLIIAGTSGVVYPSAGLPEAASERGAFIIDCNLQETPFKDLPYYHLLKGPSGRMLPALVKKVYELKNIAMPVSSANQQPQQDQQEQQQQQAKM